MQYRAEIDGLRTIAVMPVILFHAGLDVFSGGYVGVDVFFVISGYLITSLIVIEMQRGEFSILQFYERRARRILPALFLVMLCCFPFAVMWMQPVQLVDFAQSVVAVIFFVSNFLFWRESGYFAETAEEKPLLHTWSLAVEEQYYLLFPLFVIVVWRFGRRPTLYLVMIGTILSFLLSEWGARNSPIANFYLAPSRVWELLCGSICALIITQHGQKKSDVLAAIGLLLITYAIFMFDDETPFPSVYTSIPVLGAVLIILFSGPGTWVTSLLSTKPFVAIGLISYSAYLWHQPLFAFARIRSVFEPSPVLMMGLATTALMLAGLSWKFVEQPFRNRSFIRSRNKIFGLSGAAGAGIVAIAAILLVFPVGSNSRTDQQAADVRVRGLATNCESPILTNCKTTKTPQVLVWGDSYAMQVVPAISEVFSEAGIAQYTKSACNPVIGIVRLDPRYDDSWVEDCMNFNTRVLSVLDTNPSIETVIISSPFINLMESKLFTKDGEILPHHSLSTVDAYFFDSLSMLTSRGVGVVIISPPPWPSYGHAGDCARKSMFFYKNMDLCNYDTSALSLESLKVQQFLEGAKALKGVDVVNLQKIFCKSERCRVGAETTVFYGIGGHLSLQGSLELLNHASFVDSLIHATPSAN